MSVGYSEVVVLYMNKGDVALFLEQTLCQLFVEKAVSLSTQMLR